MYQLCRYLLASGRRCTQPAVTGGPYCRHHGVVRRTVASSILPPEFHHLHRALPFLYPEDRASIQANCFLVMRALDDRRITTQTANAFNRLLRTCQANLKPGPLHESDEEKNADAPSILAPESISGGPLKPAVGLSGGDNAGAPRLDSETWDKQKPDPAIVRRVVLTPAGEELAPPLEVWEEGEGQHPRAAAPEPHHPDCRCAQCPKPSGAPQIPDGGPLPGSPRTGLSSWGGFKPSVGLNGEDNAGVPLKPDSQISGGPLKPGFGLSGEQTEQTSPTDVTPTDTAEGALKGQGFSPADPARENRGALAPEGNPDDDTSQQSDEPYAYYEGDPVPPDPYAAKETEEEQKQERERREQILDKHKARLDKVEKQYLYTPQLADRIRDEIQQIMELEMGHEAFSYQLLPPPAS